MLCIAALLATAFTDSEQMINTKFGSWKIAHTKSYESTSLEAKAFAAFSENDGIIKAHNQLGLSYMLGHNKYSDMTWDEFSHTVMSELFLNKAPKNKRRVHLTGSNGKPHAVASFKDWVTDGAVTPVKDQGRCGSCWAFSTTGSIEGALAVKAGKLVSLSEEDLVQCDRNGDQGCNGGLMDNAFEWVEDHGICTEVAYPYTSGTGSTGTCKKTCKPSVTITGFTDVPERDEIALKSAVSMQPVSIAIEADKSAFQLYKSGIIDSTKCGTALDHGVLIVGYGTSNTTSQDYWKVKNSWGASWGEDGFVRIVRGKNMCGLALQASYATGAKAIAPGPPPKPPSPPTPPSPAPPTHYGDPTKGCLADETEITIQGIAGDFCTPSCSIFKHCPADMPAGVTAKPQCALSDAATGKRFCALICAPSVPILDQKAADSQCGANASCKEVQLGLGLCTYDD
uniref:Peptidase C1A papain C-terminal domain-containing protein n=2 Tax=Coccolithus braarudii TaxID=221442 RepID=A0A7S0LJJ6_9EUKA|mmetsp:Transcript_43743/g.93074  ORF Transcript_43743/g.93074 Transcript_43743/m.93074 type:complete len:454 (+) Transcript_43743:65-1426(+)